MGNEKKVYGSLLFKLTERIGTRGITAVVSIIMARLMSPDEYGTLAIMLVFTRLADTIVQGGFGIALVQKRNPTAIDYSSMMICSMGLSFAFYIAIFLLAPYISNYYTMPELSTPFRVLALCVVFSSVNSILMANLEKGFQFKRILLFNLSASLVSGLIGITCAVCKYGIWALVAQQVTNSTLLTIILITNHKGLGICGFSSDTVRKLYRFGWKLMVANLMNTIYNDLRTLIIGRRYSAEQLGYYDKGKQMPAIIGTVISDSVKSVLLPTLSEYQTEQEKMHDYARRTLRLAATVIFPLLFGFAAIAKSFTILVLGAQWADSVVYARLYGFAYAFYAYGIINVQAFNALGRSDMFLKYDGLKKIIGIGVLIITVVCFNNPLAVAIGGTLVFCLTPALYCPPNRSVFGYTVREQASDLLPPLILSFAMFGALWAFEKIVVLPMPVILLLQTAGGFALYAFLLRVFCADRFRALLHLLKGFSGKKFFKRRGE